MLELATIGSWLAGLVDWQHVWASFREKFDGWFIFGMVFQMFFTARFVVQWLASEKAKQSVIPVSFWYLSLVGTTGVFIYACVRHDPVFIVAQAMGSVIYVRNLVLINRGRAAGRPAGSSS